jgi:rubrerythrin
LEELGATASTVISFAERLEEDSSKFYDGLATAYPEQAELFQTLARDCRKNKVFVTRTYQETVTDALETGYSFKGLVLHDFMPHVGWQDGMTLSTAVEAAIALESKAAELYGDLAERSATLLSTIPSAFRKIRDNRKAHALRLEAVAKPPSRAPSA